ncbi:MAG: ornithine cyclodeaminase family domain [Candidatus Zipacnadales bacterium]
MVEELIDLHGPLLQTPTLAKIIQSLTLRGAEFEVVDFQIGKTPDTPSWMRLRVTAQNAAELARCLDEITRLGAEIVDAADVQVERVEADGLLPEGTYTLTGLPTEIRARGKWLTVSDPIPNAVIRVDHGTMAVAVPLERVKKGDRVVVRREGVRVLPETPDPASHLFGLIGGIVSAGRPRGPAIIKLAQELQRVRGLGGRVAFAIGPAVVHMGAAEYLSQLIRAGHVDLLIANNALAVYDVEAALYGTSRGVFVAENLPSPHGLQNTIHALNAIRVAGGLKAAMKQGLLTHGILHACIASGVPYLLTGSIRDEAALPDTITDTVQARARLRELLPGTALAILIAEASLARAMISSLPGPVPKVYVDISDYDVAKLVERGAPTVLGLVESAETFLRELSRNLGAW